VSTWTINNRPLAMLGVTSPTLTRGSWGEHALEIEMDGRNATSAPAWADGATVTLRYGSTVRFVGEIVAPERRAQSGAEGHSLRAVNAWIILEETVYEQTWAILGGTSTASKARCIIGMKPDGTFGTLADAITDVLAFAGVAAGSISLPQTEEPWEVRNVTCAEVLRQIQRMAPRSVAWWTYPGGVPTFHVSDEPTLVTLAMTPKTLVSLRPNRRQAVRGVRLQYEIVSESDGVQQTDVVEDTAGATSGRRIYMQTIPWRGASATFARMRTTVVTIPTAIADDKTKTFWLSHCAPLRGAKTMDGDDITPDWEFSTFDPADTDFPRDYPSGSQPYGPVGPAFRCYFAVRLARVDGKDGTGPYELSDPEDTESDKIRLDTDLTRMLIAGAVTPWMEDMGKTAQKWTLYAIVKWTDAATRQPKKTQVSINLTATDCVNKEYTSIQNYADGDPVPTGLAAELYAALSQTYHEGEVARIEDECTGFAREGNSLQVTGGPAEWESMNALIQGVREDIGGGLTTLTVGVGPNLAPGDMLELLRRERARAEADSRLGVTNSGSKEDGLP
jgi:hypothetical protein